jgi:hypothetical protein
MSMDNAQSLNDYDPYTRWRFSRPIPVYQFLNHLIPLDGIITRGPASHATTVSEYLGERCSIDSGKLKRFLNGHMFFTHFIRVESKISIATLVRAWNRGAAIMCQAFNPRFDHVIPVLLEDGQHANFGPLYNQWNEDQLEAARQHMSYILIDSKNYNNKTNWLPYVGGVTPQPMTDRNRTLHNLRDGLPIHNVYLSMVQDFGERAHDEPPVMIEPISLPTKKNRPRPRNTELQLKIVMKGCDEDTYPCLKDRLAEVEKRGRDTDRESTRMYFREIRSAKAGYLDMETDTKAKRMVYHGIKDSLPLIFGQEDEEGMGQEWMDEREKFRETMEDVITE